MDVLVVEVFAVKLLADNDVVLTDYESLKRMRLLYNRIHWHRIVLDECQEVKVATNLIAHQVIKSEVNCSLSYSN